MQFEMDRKNITLIGLATITDKLVDQLEMSKEIEKQKVVVLQQINTITMLS